jgi:hypothetical protein
MLARPHPEETAAGRTQDHRAPPRWAVTCQTRGMRIMRSILGVLGWRLRIGLSGLRLRFRSLLAVIMVLGGAGAAVGYAVADRMLSDQDETTDRLDA